MRALIHRLRSLGRRWTLPLALLCLLLATVALTAASCQEIPPLDGEPTATSAADTSAGKDTSSPDDTSRAEDATTAPREPDTMPEPDLTPAEPPRLDITTEGGAAVTSKETYVRATVTLSGCDEAYAFADIPAGIRVRGNSTATAPKKPYRLKFDVKQGMLGLNGGKKFKSWCLMADYFDASMLRTFGTFRMAAALMQKAFYASDCTHVEVYLNGQYQGVYLLCEQTQINKNRVNIPERPDGDTTLEHGYLLIGQGGRSDEPETVYVYPDITVRDRNGNTMHFGTLIFALSGSGYTEEQKQYVSNYVSGVFKVVAHAVYDGVYYDLARNGTLSPKRSFEWAVTEEEKAIETISAVFNLESAVSMCILDEIVKNLDAMTFNMYVDLSPEGDGILTLAAPWDFDFSMANTHYASTHSPHGFYATNLSYSEGMRTNLWYVLLGSIGWFEDMVREKWQASYPALLATLSELVSVNAAYDAAFSRDWATWGAGRDRALIHHHATADLAGFDTHMQAGSFVTDWLAQRLWWLDTQWGDGRNVLPSAEIPEELGVTFDSEASLSYLTAFKRCEVTLTPEGLRMTPAAGYGGYDPYFTILLNGKDSLGQPLTAEQYPYLEFTYRIPAGHSQEHQITEIFLCSGNITGATGGWSVATKVVADGEWHTVRIDLLASGKWSGVIHSLRMDFFGVCTEADEMFLREIKLLQK